MFERRSLWETEFFRLSQADALIAPGFRAWMSDSQSRLGQFLASVEYNSKFQAFSYAEVRELEAMIFKASGRKADALPPLRLLRKIVYQLNRLLQFSIPQPTLAIHLVPLINPLVFSDLSLAHRSVQAWLEAEKIWLTDLRESPDFKARKGCNVPFELLLLSAALHGGILNRDLAFALYAAVLEPARYLRHSSTRGYVDLPAAWHGQLNQEIRRWYPDDALVCLLARLLTPDPSPSPAENYSDQRQAFCDRMARRLTAELLQRGVPAEFLPRSVADLFQRIIIVLRSEMPAVMVDYAARQIDARSLLAPSIDLIYGDPGFQSISPEGQDDPGEADIENTEPYGGDRPDDLEPSWMESVRACCQGARLAEFKERFSQLGEPESKVARRIIGFTKRLIGHGSSSGYALKPNSIKCCVLTVARRLGAQLCERDPADIPSETLEDLYVNAIDQAAEDSDNPPRLQATVAWALREFHRYLRREGLAKPLNEGDVFRVPRGFLPVDATIVSIDDVAKALDYLRYEPNSKWSDRNREIARVSTLLGFFAGLRTMEGLGARRKDFPGGPFLPFRVLASDSRDLKTPNATRTIFVSMFMSPFEDVQRIASAWAESDGHDDPLASLFDGASDDVIISMINETLRAVTGNDRVRYYNLRHSFASWTITRLLLSELPEIPDLFPHLPMTSVWLQHSTDFRSNLYGNDRVHNDHAWALATLMGHSRPNVSFANYCHTLDILLPEYLRLSKALQSALSHRARLRLSGSDSQSGAYAKLPAQTSTAKNQPTLWTRVDEVRQEQDGHVAPEVNAKAGQIALPLGNEERIYALTPLRDRYPDLQAPHVQLNHYRDRSWLEQTWGLLSMAYKPQRDFGTLVEYLGLTRAEAALIIDRAIEICALTSPASTKHLHTITNVTAPTESVTDFVYPTIPRAAALKLAGNLALQIGKAIEKNEDVPVLLDYFCRNVWPNSATLVFRFGESYPWDIPIVVQRYRRLLAGLGIKEKDLWFEGCDGTCSKFPRVDWYSKWGLRARPTCKIINRHGKRAKAIALGEWLSITPRAACRNAAEEFDRVFFDAFRFSMLHAGVRFGRQTRLRSS